MRDLSGRSCSGNTPKIALLVVHTKTFFPRMLELGKSLKRSGAYEPVYYLAYKSNWPNLDEDVNWLNANELRLSSLCSVKGSSESLNAFYLRSSNRGVLDEIKDEVRRLENAFRKSLLSIFPIIREIRDFFRELWILTRRFHFVRQLIVNESASILVLSIDIPPYDTSVFVKAAHSQNIPAVFTISCTRLSEESREVYSDMPELSLKRWVNYLTGKAYPHWRAEYKGKKFLMINAGKIWVRELLALAPPLPWVEGSSNADAVLAENEKFYEDGLSVGLPADRVFLTGHTVHDDMARVLRDADIHREELYRQLGLPQKRPMILTSLIPPYADRVRPSADFKSYGEFLDFWLKTLSQIRGYNVVVCLHPSMKLENYIYLEKWGVKISQASIAMLIPLCDIFVTSVSSTMSYAAACGKPVINFDAFLYRNTMFKGEPGIITVENKAEFCRVISGLIHDKELYSQVAHNQAAAAHRWGRLDGQAFERILDVFDRLTEKYRRLNNTYISE